MAFLNKLFMAAVHVATTPIAVVTDTVGLTEGCTRSTIKAAARNVEQSVDNLADGDLI